MLSPGAQPAGRAVGGGQRAAPAGVRGGGRGERCEEVKIVKEDREGVYILIQAVQFQDNLVHDPRTGEAVEKGTGQRLTWSHGVI